MEATLWNSLICWFTPTVLFVVLNIVIGTIAVVSKCTGTNKEEIDGRPAAALSRSPSLLQRLRSFDFGPLYDQDRPQEYTPNPTNMIGGNSEQDCLHAPAIARQPSFLQRIRSIRHYRSDTVEVRDNDTAAGAGSSNSERPHTRQPASLLQRMRSIKLYPQDIPPEEDDQEWQTSVPICSKEPTALPEQQQQKQQDIRPSKSDQKSSTVIRRKKGMGRSVGEREVVADHSPAAAAAEGEEEEGGEVDARADDFINRFRQQLKLQRLDSILRYTEMLKRGL